ncbi:MAG: hypothetical protein FJY76_02725 [Candidatus Aenigmarchaeota archaeon]|nr:hypothetical protein [Candidatus Aenigmarchaeota archaeon]
MTDYADILKKSLRFSVHPKRWLPFFIVDAVFYAAVIQFVLSNLGGLVGMMSSAELSLEAAATFVYFIGTVLAMSAVFWLIRTWVQGAVILQSAREKDRVAGTFNYGLRRYISLVLATAVVAIIGMAVSIVPYIGSILSIIVSIVLVFVAQGVMVSKMGFAGALGSAFDMFRNRPGSVFLAWLATALVSLIIAGIFLLPAFAAFGVTMLPALVSMGAEASIMSVVLLMMQNITLLAVVGVIFTIGTSIAAAFSTKSLTEFYMAWHKRKLV